MCYHAQIKANLKKIARRFNADVDNPDSIIFDQDVNGFAHPALPVITNTTPSMIMTDYHWGLIPAWCKDDSIRKNTLNARIETLEDKPAFRNVIHNRCLVIATGYYEWRWNDEKGKSKQKFEIHSAEEEIFAFAGLYSTWTNPLNNQTVNSFSIVTTAANRQMEYIHNIKKRMPIILKPEDEKAWLKAEIPFSHFAYPNYEAEIVAFTV